MSINTTGIEFTTFSEAEPEKCLICLDEMTSGLAHTANEVFHRFHADCLQPWMEQNQSCPTCRKPVTSINGVPLIAAPHTPSEHPLITAIRNGDINADLLLLNNDDTITDEIRARALITAAQYDHIGIVRVLLTDPTISEGSRSVAIAFAAQSGHMDIVRLLLTDRPISLSTRVIVSTFALAGGDFDLPRELLTSLLSQLVFPVAMLARSALMGYFYNTYQNLETQA